MLRALGDRGYAFAKLKGAIKSNVNRHVADVTFTLAPGEVIARLRSSRHHRIERRTRKARASRARSRAPGELYSSSKLESARPRHPRPRGLCRCRGDSGTHRRCVAHRPGQRSWWCPPSCVRSRSGEGSSSTPFGPIGTCSPVGKTASLGGVGSPSTCVPGLVLYPTSTSYLKAPNRYLPRRARAWSRASPDFSTRAGHLPEASSMSTPSCFAPRTRPRSSRSSQATAISRRLDRTTGPVREPFLQLPNELPVRLRERRAPQQLQEGRDLLPESGHHPRLSRRHRPPALGLFLRNDVQFAGIHPATFRSAHDLLAAKEHPRSSPKAMPHFSFRCARRWTLALRATTGFLIPTPGAPTATARAEPTTTCSSPLAITGITAPLPRRGTERKSLVLHPGGEPARMHGQMPTRRPARWRSKSCAPSPRTPRSWPAIPERRPSGCRGKLDRSSLPHRRRARGAVFCDASDVSRYRWTSAVSLSWPSAAPGCTTRGAAPVGAAGSTSGFNSPGSVLKIRSFEAGKIRETASSRSPSVSARPSDVYRAPHLGRRALVPIASEPATRETSRAFSEAWSRVPCWRDASVSRSGARWCSARWPMWGWPPRAPEDAWPRC